MSAFDDELKGMGVLDILKHKSEQEALKLRVNALEKKFDSIKPADEIFHTKISACRSTCSTSIWNASAAIIAIALAFFAATFFFLKDNIEGVEKRIEGTVGLKIERLTDKFTQMAETVNKMQSKGEHP
ncbi:MAG: hypothetical protein Q8O00_11145 [Holophaga sp.]|nr:hypothetical protein [Holophaga sp.]